MKNIVFREIGDKAISVGESSEVIGDSITISDAYIAVASKDKSIFKISDIDMNECIYNFVAFQKKPEYGTSSIIVKDGISKLNEFINIIQSGCTFIYRDKTILGTENSDVEELLYGKQRQ